MVQPVKSSWFAGAARFSAAKVVDFFGAVPGALRSHLNAQELARISAAAVTAGGGVFGVLQAVLVDVGTVFPAPADAALAALVLTAILESRRRLTHGAAPPAMTTHPESESLAPINRRARR